MTCYSLSLVLYHISMPLDPRVRLDMIGVRTLDEVVVLRDPPGSSSRRLP